MAVANAINEQTTGICGFTGTAFTGTAVSQYKVQVGGATSSTLSEVGPGSSGQVLQSGGAAANPAYSTATYPATATGTGKILRADGTNWAATTATFPDTAGTSGNVLTSDGTNWSSAAPASSYSFNYSCITSGWNPSDGITYYFTQAGVPLTTSSATSVRIYMTTACTINKIYGRFGVTAGSAENCTLFIRKNDTSNTNVSTTIQLNAAVDFNNTSLGISLVAGDFISVGFTSPTWVTNPTSITLNYTFST